jgi:ribosomal protein S21
MGKKNKEKVRPVGLEVYVNLSGENKKDREAVDFALRELKKKIKKSGLMQELRMRESYMSPSKYKKFRKNEAIKRRKRDERKNEWSHKNSTEW